MKVFAAFFLLLLNGLSIFAQDNLVPNPSFEDLPVAITSWSNTREEFNENMSLWTSPTEGTPDIYNKYYEADWTYRIQGLGIDEPQDGKTMIGITTFVPEYSNKVHKREYAQIQLKETLEKGNSYQFSCFVKSPKKTLRASHLGFLLTKDSFYVQTDRVVRATPIYEIDTILDARGWTEVAFEFSPKENVEYLTIGNFQADSLVEFSWLVKRPSLFAYYYIDNVKIVKIEKEKPVSTPLSPVFAVGKVFTLDNIYFEYDKATLLASSFPELQKLKNHLIENPNIILHIQGHTDHDGDLDYNKQLSLARSKSVATYLIENGINENRLTYEGFGETKPMAENDTEVGKQKNRRVEFILSEVEK